jgi:hypothetical protein
VDNMNIACHTGKHYQTIPASVLSVFLSTLLRLSPGGSNKIFERRVLISAERNSHVRPN